MQKNIRNRPEVTLASALMRTSCHNEYNQTLEELIPRHVQASPQLESSFCAILRVPAERGSSRSLRINKENTSQTLEAR
eukprot:5757888-Alexandrium_andersonii.AAC.2